MLSVNTNYSAMVALQNLNFTNTELGNSPTPQLYDLKQDVGETKNVAGANPAKIEELKALLAQALEIGERAAASPSVSHVIDRITGRGAVPPN